MAKLKFTANITCVFEFEGNYAEAQAWLIKQLSENDEETNMNLQRVDLIRWSDPVQNRPIDARTGRAVDKK